MQQYVRDGDFIMPFLDNSTYIQKEVNVSASLREGRTVIGQTLNENGMGVELLVFDYEGNYIRGVKLDRNFLSYSWDPESKILYAAEIVSEVIFTYDLSDFL